MVKQRTYAGMSLYSIVFLSQAGHILSNRQLEANNVYDALAHANHLLWAIRTGAAPAPLDPRGRVDVLDHRGAAVAHIPCAEALIAMS